MTSRGGGKSAIPGASGLACGKFLQRLLSTCNSSVCSLLHGTCINKTRCSINGSGPAATTNSCLTAIKCLATDTRVSTCEKNLVPNNTQSTWAPVSGGTCKPPTGALNDVTQLAANSRAHGTAKAVAMQYKSTAKQSRTGPPFIWRHAGAWRNSAGIIAKLTNRDWFVTG